METHPSVRIIYIEAGTTWWAVRREAQWVALVQARTPQAVVEWLNEHETMGTAVSTSDGTARNLYHLHQLGDGRAFVHITSRVVKEVSTEQAREELTR